MLAVNNMTKEAKLWTTNPWLVDQSNQIYSNKHTLKRPCVALFPVCILSISSCHQPYIFNDKKPHKTCHCPLAYQSPKICYNFHYIWQPIGELIHTSINGNIQCFHWWHEVCRVRLSTHNSSINVCRANVFNVNNVLPMMFWLRR